MASTLDLAGLQKLLLGVAAAQAVAITAMHEPAMTVRRNPFRGRVLKKSRVNGFINFRYESVVRKQQKREAQPAEFVAAPRKWGSRIRGCPLVIHVSDQGLHLYLELKLERAERLYFDKATREPIDAKLLAPFLKKRRPGRQHLKKQVELRDYRLDHISELRIAGTVHCVTPIHWLQLLLDKAAN
jgi:hypothetical protein